MLTRTKIRSLTHASFYARGLDLYLTDSVLELRVKEKSFVDSIEARVKGSGTKTYSVRMRYDDTRDEVVDCECDCPAFYSYDGLCKHLVAAMLKYVDRKGFQRKERALQEGENGREKGSSLFQNREENRKPTTPVMKRLLDQQVIRRTAPLTQSQVFGKVCLEPVLSLDGDKATAEFRIGVDQKYVLKDVLEFADRMERGDDYEYGKKLRFVHLQEAFEASSRPLVQFLRSWVKENGDRYRQSRYVGTFYVGQTRLRELPLSGSDLESLIEAVGQRPLNVILKDGTGLDRGSSWEADEFSEDFEEPLRLLDHLTWVYTEGAAERFLRITGQEEGILLEARQPRHYPGKRHEVCFQEGHIYLEPLERTEPIRDFQDCVEAAGSEGIYIQKEDVPAFCRDVLPVLEKYYRCTRENFREQDYDVVPVTFEIYLDAPQPGIVTCRAMAVYGDRKYNIYGEKTDAGQRDLVREIALGQEIAKYCNAYDTELSSMAVANSEDQIYEILTEGIPRFQELGEVFVSDALKRISIPRTLRVTVGISLSGDLLELSMNSEDISREELLEILNRYDRRKKYYRLRNGDFINVQGEDLETLVELKQALGLSEKQLRSRQVTLPKYRALFLDGELKGSATLSAVKNRSFRSLVRHMRTVEDNDFEVPESLRGVLREYQEKGFLWLKTLKHNGFGGILADDMGLGKTLQVLAFLWSELLEAGPSENCRSLIVTPASLVYNWYNEVRRFVPELPVTMVVGTGGERQALIQGAGSRDLLITSYDLLKRDLEYYEGMDFHCQVIDEAQFIKNQNTQAARAVKGIQAACRLALTGTPMENRLSELWSIFDYLMPGFLYSYQKFREEMEGPIVQQQDKAAMERLQKMIRPFVLRRLKKDVLKDLPEKLEEDLYAVLEGEQGQLYDAHVKRLALMLDKQTEKEFQTARIQILAELTKLRQLCCDPALLYEGFQGESAKKEMCLELVRNAVSGGHKILLFSQFTSMLEILCDRLSGEGITYYALTGSTSKEKRRELVDRFQQDDTSVFCISLKAGGTGLNLTAADIVIHYDPWWNLAVQEQAEDRAHRIGQKNTVTVYKLITKGTIEENILRLQEKKRELADRVLSGDGIGSGSFTREELLEIIGLADR